ncbi:Na(+)/H(+) antiporter subunit C [Streptomyces sp. Tu 3180]|uniref:Na(+)/H(+) antiporter subunit C n=1 Tax=Streptomyces sp. Tu 3180 TaxID=2682611 RepID=UPI00135AEFA9|nr:Na(+)/H(+) antiporter subunit C [Streptomyces sp. Tu 3180]KAF3468964.1 Na(+)/H(+) antiporter subunit C [Streptomyces sp. Tu 3180]
MNTIDVTLSLVVGGLFTVGFYLMLQRSLMRIVLGFLVLGHGTNLLLLVGGGTPGLPPVLDGAPPDPERIADPLPQAMALTSIVITFGLTAFLMALAYRSWHLTGSDEVPDDPEDRRIGATREHADEDKDTYPDPEPDPGSGAVPADDGTRRGGDR